MQAFFQNFSKNFFGPAGGPKSTARTRHRQRPLSPHRKRGLPIFLSQKVSRRQACARTRHRQRPLSPHRKRGLPIFLSQKVSRRQACARTRHRQRPLSPHRKRGLPIFLSQKVSRRQACARTRHGQRPLSPTPNAGRLSSSCGKFRAPKARARIAWAAGAKKQPPDWATASCVGEHLSSRAVTSQVFSARTSLTSVFGMGTGGPSS